MARATIISTRKAAQRIAMQALVLLRLVVSDPFFVFILARTYCVSAMNLPAMRRSPLWRDMKWMWRRFVLMMSDGYNFEEFYRTQHGITRNIESDRAGDLGQMSTRQLLNAAYDLARAQEGIVAMRELVARAEKKATERVEAPARASYKPTAHDPSIHRQWHEAIETAFAQDRRSPRVAVPLSLKSTEARPKKGSIAEPPEWASALPMLAEDDAAFELRIPQIVPYRASTRH